MEYLEKEDIILINQLTIKRHGGNFVPPFNLLNESSLDYLIEAVSGEIFGQEMYSTVAEKAGLYIYSIISGHIFQDGNKRTGLESGLLFLKLNGFELKENLVKINRSENQTIPKSGESKNEILYNFIIEIASGEIDQKRCKTWLEEKDVQVWIESVQDEPVYGNSFYIEDGVLK